MMDGFVLTEDMREGWIIEVNDCSPGQPDDWQPAWETWFIDDNDKANAVEMEYMKRGEEPHMKPRPFEVVLELLKQVRPLDNPNYDWKDYRFKNVTSGMVIHACILK